MSSNFYKFPENQQKTTQSTEKKHRHTPIHEQMLAINYIVTNNNRNNRDENINQSAA